MKARNEKGEEEEDEEAPPKKEAHHDARNGTKKEAPAPKKENPAPAPPKKDIFGATTSASLKVTAETTASHSAGLKNDSIPVPGQPQNRTASPSQGTTTNTKPPEGSLFGGPKPTANQPKSKNPLFG